MTFARDVGGQLFSAGQSHTSDFSQRGVWFLRSNRLHLKTNSSSLRRTFQQWCFAAGTLLFPRLSDQLINCRHKTQLLCDRSKNDRFAKKRIEQSTGGSARRQPSNPESQYDFPERAGDSRPDKPYKSSGVRSASDGACGLSLSSWARRAAISVSVSIS